MVLDARLRKLATGVSAGEAAHAYARSLRPSEMMDDQSKAQAEEFEATLEAMFLMAAVDGVIQKEEIEQLAASLTVYASDNDRALGFARDALHAGEFRLGQRGPHLEAVDRREKCDGIDTTDVNLGTFELLHHSNLGNNRCVLNDARLLLLNTPAGQRPLTRGAGWYVTPQCR